MSRRPSTSSGRTDVGRVPALHVCAYLTDTGSGGIVSLDARITHLYNSRVELVIDTSAVIAIIVNEPEHTPADA